MSFDVHLFVFQDCRGIGYTAEDGRVVVAMDSSFGAFGRSLSSDEAARQGYEDRGGISLADFAGSGTFTDGNGRSGVGFCRERGFATSYCVAWDDGTAERIDPVQAESRGVVFTADVAALITEPQDKTESDWIREHLEANGIDTKNGDVVEALKERGIVINSSQVSRVRSKMKADAAA